MKHIKLFEEFINEARSIEKIEKDRTKVINDMAEMVTNWKAAKASGDKEAEASFLQTLKDLTAKKNELAKELTSAIASKDRFIELVISENNTIYESVMSEIDLLAKDSKNFKEFLKAFKTDNRYKGLDTVGDAKEFESWLKSVYDSAKENMDESSINETGFKKSDIKKTIDFINKEIGADPGYALMGDEEDIEEFNNLWGRGKYEDAFDVLVVATNMEISTLNDVKNAIKESSIDEGENAAKSIHDHWFEIYGEKFINEYPKVAKILKNRPNVDRRELARIWDEVYGEDFKEKYPAMWDVMDEETVYERNAFLAARARAIEEDMDEFEFNGKTYPVLNKPN
jgi:hypothetical protein